LSCAVGALLWQAITSMPPGWWAGSGLAGWWVAARQACRVEVWLSSGTDGVRLVEQRPGELGTAVVWGWQPACSFSALWHGEGFCKLRVQVAKVSALPGTLSQARMSPESQQGP
jgi:hypothetical protein